MFELGGPDAKTLHEWVDVVLKTVHRRRLVLNLPFWIGRMVAFGFDALEIVTLGLIKNRLVTRDQIKQLGHQNVVSEGAKGLEDLGIEPQATEAILPDYLWRFRPAGQYEAIKESAENLRA